MLSHDELRNGRTFILKLWDSAGAPSQWVQLLRDDTARRWYDIYRRSDWAALRSEGADVFHDRVTSEEAERVRKSGRCVFIQTTSVRPDEMATRCGPSSPARAGAEGHERN